MGEASVALSGGGRANGENAALGHLEDCGKHVPPDHSIWGLKGVVFQEDRVNAQYLSGCIAGGPAV